MYKYNYVVRATNKNNEVLEQPFSEWMDANDLELWLDFVGAEWYGIMRGDEEFPYDLYNETV